MKLRFAPAVLAVALSISAEGTRNTGETTLGGEFYNTGIGNEITSRRRAELISTIGSQQGVNSGRSIYNPDVGALWGGKEHRLRNAFMNGRVRRGSHSAVLGVPDNTTVPRLLQAEADPLCGTNGTCLPNACDCLANGDFVSYECSQVFHSLCNGYTDADGKHWTFEGCYRGHPDFPGLQEYNRNYGCPLWKCIVEGGTYGSCFCQLYHSLCQTYGDDRPYAVCHKCRNGYSNLHLSSISCLTVKSSLNCLLLDIRMTRGRLGFVPRTNAAKVRRTRLVECHARSVNPIEWSTAMRIQGVVEPMPHAAPVSVTVVPTDSKCLPVLLHFMLYVLEKQIRMESGGSLKDASGTIPIIPNTICMRERRIVRWPSVLLTGMELMVRVIARCIIRFVTCLGTSASTM